jgi:hypothetical protein
MGGEVSIVSPLPPLMASFLQVPAHTEFFYEQPYVEGGGAQTSDILKQRLRR